MVVRPLITNCNVDTYFNLIKFQMQMLEAPEGYYVIVSKALCNTKVMERKNTLPENLRERSITHTTILFTLPEKYLVCFNT